MKTVLLFILLQSLVSIAAAQQLSNLRQKFIPVHTDTVNIDSLSIIPGTVAVHGIDSTAFRVLYIRGILVWNSKSEAHKNHKADSIKITYRVFPFLLGQTYRHKDPLKIVHKAELYNPFLSRDGTGMKDELFRFDGLNKSGSISRGISLGNNQNVVLNSNLNLQLSGKVSDNVEVLAAITDDNIPVQPDGNTQQLQDFDKVYIQVFNKTNKLHAGDFELKRPDSYFMNIFKRSQGGSYSGTFKLPSSHVNKESFIKTDVAAAIARGRFTRNTITGTEGNQGPYRLRGINNESFIVILSGSERVYLNGELLVRGQQNDYVIDYNTAEITFTPKRLITKDSRLVAEFEYSDRNYARSLFFVGNEYRHDKLKMRFNFYTEQDGKNQPLQQNLSDDQKLLLNNIGDRLDSAVISSEDSVAFNPADIMYEKADTSVGGVLYNDIFVHSVDPSKAFFKVTFSAVGQGNGNYRQKTSVANGRVYEWVAPVNGLPQGSYEPKMRLVTPKQQQMFTFGTDYATGSKSLIRTEVAFSNNNVNLYSRKDKGDDYGLAFRTGFRNSRYLGKVSIDTTGRWKLNTTVDYEYVNRNFKALERYRDVEFTRDWNTSGFTTISDEHLPLLGLSLLNNKTGVLSYQFRGYSRGKEYLAGTNSLQADLSWKQYRIVSSASYLQSDALIFNTAYLKHKADLSRKFHYFTAGLKEETETNMIFRPGADSLQLNSFSFNEYQAYISSPDTFVNKYSFNVTQRNDFLPLAERLKGSSQARSAGFMLGLLKNKASQFTLNTTYRELQITDSTLTKQAAGSTFLNRAEYNLTLWKGAVTSTTYYEIGTGQELKKDFIYIETSPGQGVYFWNDYNSNGIRELNEFEVAAFQNQANYVKIYIPSNEYVGTFSNQFNEVLNLTPSAVIQNPAGLKGLLSRFSNQTLLRMDRKTMSDGVSASLNPFLTAIPDSELISVNSSLRNIFYFNRNNATWGADLNYLDSRNKILLTNGFEYRILTERGINARWNFSKVFGLQASYKDGEKINSVAFASSRDYRIVFHEAEPKLSYQPGTSFRTILFYKIIQRQNINETGGEKANIGKTGVEIKYTTITSGSITGRVTFIQTTYNASENTPVAFEMLEGLRAGKNMTWNVSVQRNLARYMQMNLSYEGRKSEGIDVIHTGNVQLRAFF